MRALRFKIDESFHAVAYCETFRHSMGICDSENLIGTIKAIPFCGGLGGGFKVALMVVYRGKWVGFYDGLLW